MEVRFNIFRERYNKHCHSITVGNLSKQNNLNYAITSGNYLAIETKSVRANRHNLYILWDWGYTATPTSLTAGTLPQRFVYHTPSTVIRQYSLHCCFIQSDVTTGAD